MLTGLGITRGRFSRHGRCTCRLGARRCKSASGRPWLIKHRLGTGAALIRVVLLRRGTAAAFRKLRFDGDITTYIRRLSIVVVRFVNESCEYYNHVFDDDLQSSGPRPHPRPLVWTCVG